jgi:histidine triad (HIT) family protein
MPTLFEKIAAGDIPARFAHRDDLCIAIHDIAPQAPVHVLVIPRRPIPRVGEAGPDDAALLGHLLLVAGRLARDLGLERGFRIVINHGPDGGESVPHLHVHLLGGRPLHWPPG